MNKRDRAEFEKRLENQDFECRYVELAMLKAQKYPDLVLTVEAPRKQADIRAGKEPVQVAIVNPGHNPDVVLARAKQCMDEVTVLARWLSAFFPEGVRWHWQEVFRGIALAGNGMVLVRGGGPEPTPEGEIACILAEWDRVKGNELKENFAARKGVSVRQLQRWDNNRI